MTQEEKELLLKDLCARLPYRVKITWNEEHWVTVTPSMYMFICEEQDFTWKPYLRPMSSMTEEERDELELICSLCSCDNDCNYQYGIEILSDYHTVRDEPFKELDWLNAHHFDYRGLIEKGLAIEAPEDMYK